MMYKLTFEIDDDPAHFEAIVTVAAGRRSQALRLAKDAAIRSYNDYAGGWSLMPKAQLLSCEQYTPPAEGVVAVTGYYTR